MLLLGPRIYLNTYIYGTRARREPGPGGGPRPGRDPGVVTDPGPALPPPPPPPVDLGLAGPGPGPRLMRPIHKTNMGPYAPFIALSLGKLSWQVP